MRCCYGPLEQEVRGPRWFLNLPSDSTRNVATDIGKLPEDIDKPQSESRPRLVESEIIACAVAISRQISNLMPRAQTGFIFSRLEQDARGPMSGVQVLVFASLVMWQDDSISDASGIPRREMLNIPGEIVVERLLISAP